ncbi:MurR/RpiR family transcriptional regulator [Listeria monocytogenes]|uniref:MurR/RpiR family transcriptional regulator n=1 Tax=Listeria TaxID=1637 RepID=UPI0010F00D84|nr:MULTISPECIES: MurR/RpiR family transcriptional regulator [Listeria]EAD7633097.1 MurR/RpiR family transcriptional regulator [Listeria monocytogenes]EAD7633258.1 MurR/RpiR family transcriptional regulator [Listeria monocytogenes]EKZ4336137.1 MurR/RpiR family transcriptional regulator [Listeria monocytogenes]EKZ4847807.1 MurR/RpiR family transcriptional regulator [Listeria monocytogenes]MBC1385513.1 MurR/RpiR family transcriptional regulator [Listeria innocua]
MKLVDVLQRKEAFKFNQAEAEIASYTLANPQKVIHFSIRGLASELYISPSSIVRFTKKIGLTGYSDFKMQVASELTYFSKDDSPLVQLDLPIESKQSINEIAKTMMNLHSQTLLDMYLNMEMKNVIEAGDLILDSDWISIFAKGASILVAEAFHQNLLRIGMNSHLEALNGFQLVKPIQAKKAVGLIISQYGDSREMYEIQQELTRIKVPCIYITSNKINTIWKNAKVGIYVENHETLNKMGSFASRTAFLYVTDVLYEYIFSENYDTNVRLLSDYALQSRRRNQFLGLGE